MPSTCPTSGRTAQWCLDQTHTTCAGAHHGPRKRTAAAAPRPARCQSTHGGTQMCGRLAVSGYWNDYGHHVHVCDKGVA